MTASSDPRARPLSALYSRFIPREELGTVAAWRPRDLSGADTAAADVQRAAEAAAPVEPPAPPEPPPPPPPPPAEPQITPEQLEQQVQESQRRGYEEGYRDGLAALESFKKSYAAQAGAQVGQVAAAFQARLAEVEHRLARALAGVATDIARQVVRGELATRPELIEAVAQEALATLARTARQVRVRVHPDDHALLVERAGLDLAAHEARLTADASVSLGGCIVECDIGLVDASIETRWRRAAAALGGGGEWQADTVGSRD
ncbi:FliH/SctL family protein [Caldimonas tepidiphila]|uniref:FliH/SctL family protein n=1 Tax=Caldimonas tepidiphila TaxID=2315841 RepID=UPI000E5AA2F2|nr:flagellar assembly protein FliH [Caldimonas tepidiphila]